MWMHLSRCELVDTTPVRRDAGDMATSSGGSVRTGRRLSHGAGFVVIALAFTTAMAFSTLPTPLYVLYQQRDGFPTYMITVIFAVYAVGVAASLYFVGHVSDWLGRRRIIIAALLVELLAALMFAVWNDTIGLIAARIVSGIGIGALTASATAHLTELNAVARPGSPGTANAVAGLANIGGLALGPLIAGLLAQFAPQPLVTPFVVFAVLLAIAALAVTIVPETVDRPDPLPRYRPQRVAVPSDSRAQFAAAGVAAFAAFAVFGLFTALTPSVLVAVMNENSRLAAGLVASAVFASAALTQLATGRLRLRTQIWLGTGLMLAGSALLAVVGAGRLAAAVRGQCGGRRCRHRRDVPRRDLDRGIPRASRKARRGARRDLPHRIHRPVDSRAVDRRRGAVVLAHRSAARVRRAHHRARRGGRAEPLATCRLDAMRRHCCR